MKHQFSSPPSHTVYLAPICAVADYTSRRLPTDYRESRILELARALGWGRIERAIITRGLPYADTRSKLLRVYRHGHDEASPPISLRPGAKLHSQHQKLLADCRAFQNGVIPRIEVADGLPVFWEPPRPR